MFFVVSIFSISVIVLLRFCYWYKCVYVINFIECAIYTHWHIIIVRLSDVSINMGRLQTSLKSNGKKTIFFVLKDAEVFKSISWVISKSNSYSEKKQVTTRWFISLFKILRVWNLCCQFHTPKKCIKWNCRLIDSQLWCLSLVTDIRSRWVEIDFCVSDHWSIEFDELISTPVHTKSAPLPERISHTNSFI